MILGPSIKLSIKPNITDELLRMNFNSFRLNFSILTNRYKGKNYLKSFGYW